MAIQLSELTQARFPVKVTFTLAEDGGLREETITIFYKSFTLNMLDELRVIERDDVTEPPKVTRQLVALDVQSNDITEDGQPVKLTAEKLALIGLAPQQEIMRAITERVFGFEDRRRKRESDAEDGDSQERLQSDALADANAGQSATA